MLDSSALGIMQISCVAKTSGHRRSSLMTLANRVNSLNAAGGIFAKSSARHCVGPVDVPPHARIAANSSFSVKGALMRGSKRSGVMCAAILFRYSAASAVSSGPTCLRRHCSSAAAMTASGSDVTEPSGAPNARATQAFSRARDR